MRRWLALFGLALSCAAAGSALSDQFVETFDGGSNTGQWSFGAPVEQILPAGGNPGAYLRAEGLDTYAPHPGTIDPTCIFTGDYRALGVTAVGIDLITFYVDFSAEGRPLTVVLYSDNGTPGDLSDDWAAFRIGPDNVPLPGEGWRAYDFAVPSEAMALPAGWSTIAFGPNSPATPDWNLLITDVRRLGFFYGDPEMFFIFQMWDLGLDNPRITFEIPTPVELTSWGRVKGMYR